MLEKITSFILALIAGILINLPIDFNKYDLPPTLSYYIRTLAPCAHPIYYKIGTIDPKFNITKEDIIKDSEQASEIWNNLINKKLFIYDANGPLTINFIYDERQSISTEIGLRESQLIAAKQQLTPDEAKYNSLVADFQTRHANLNEEISKWNSQGGAPPEVYARLIDEQNSLRKEADEINALVEKLNISAREYNSIVSELNQSASYFNQIIQGKPEEGLYSPSTNEISIYLIINHDELVHTLAHEFGHALGLMHTTDKKSIMYALTSKTIVATKEDSTMLNEVCSSKK